MNHLSLPRSLLILHHHFFQIESDQRRARNFRQRFQFLKALADPSLWPFKLDPISMISKLDPIFDHSKLDPIPRTIISNRNRNRICDSDFKSESYSDPSTSIPVTIISKPWWDNFKTEQSADEEGIRIRDAKSNSPSLVKICEDATRTWSEFHLHDLPRLIKVTQWKSVIFWGPDKSGSLFEFPRWLVPLLPDTVYLVTSWAAQLMWSKLVKS